MSEMRAPMDPDQSITWDTYVLPLDTICQDAAIFVPVGAEIEAELADRTALRITVKYAKRR